MDGFEKDGVLNLLKGGIQHADKITTVIRPMRPRSEPKNMDADWKQAWNTGELIW